MTPEDRAAGRSKFGVLNFRTLSTTCATSFATLITPQLLSQGELSLCACLCAGEQRADKEVDYPVSLSGVSPPLPAIYIYYILNTFQTVINKLSVTYVATCCSLFNCQKCGVSMRAFHLSRHKSH